MKLKVSLDVVETGTHLEDILEIEDSDVGDLDSGEILDWLQNELDLWVEEQIETKFEVVEE
jgi:hypothetical protein